MAWTRRRTRSRSSGGQGKEATGKPALLLARRRRLAGGGVWLAAERRQGLVRLAVDPAELGSRIAGLWVLAAARLGVAVAGHVGRSDVTRSS